MDNLSELAQELIKFEHDNDLNCVGEDYLQGETP